MNDSMAAGGLLDLIPTDTSAGGCSPKPIEKLGITQDTAGNRSFAQSAR